MGGGQELRGCHNNLVFKGVRVLVDTVEVDKVTGKVSWVFHAACEGFGSQILAQGDLENLSCLPRDRSAGQEVSSGFADRGR